MSFYGVERWGLVCGLMAVGRSENMQSFAPLKCMAAFVANPGTVPPSVTLFNALVRFEIVKLFMLKNIPNKSGKKGTLEHAWKRDSNVTGSFTGRATLWASKLMLVVWVFPPPIPTPTAPSEEKPIAIPDDLLSAVEVPAS